MLQKKYKNFVGKQRKTFKYQPEEVLCDKKMANAINNNNILCPSITAYLQIKFTLKLDKHDLSCLADNNITIIFQSRDPYRCIQTRNSRHFSLHTTYSRHLGFGRKQMRDWNQL